MNDEDDIQYYRSLKWTFSIWKPGAALLNKKGFAVSPFIGQKFDPNYFSIDPAGWTHGHCELCWKSFCANDEECETSGFECDGQWICTECHNKIMV